jgi:nucleoside-diphosphate-sugar epimerase
MNRAAYDMPGTRPDAIDGADAAQVHQACEGADVIYLCLNAHYVDWYTLFPSRLEAAIEAAASTGATLVYHDNIYVYGPVTRPLSEDLPYTTETRKGKLRGEMATRFLQAARSGKIRGVIGRTADMYGPGALNSSFNSTLGERHFYPLLAGQSVNLLGDIDKPHTYAFVSDVARDLVTLAENDEALGQVWHLPAAPTLSHRELMTLAFEEAGLAPKIRGSRISGYFLRLIGLFQRDVAEVAEMLYQFEKPVVVSHQKFQAAYGARPTSHREALRQTLAWYRSNAL